MPCNKSAKSMFEHLFGDKKKVATGPPELMRPEERRRAVEGSSTAELAARLLIAPTALMQLTPEEALTVVLSLIHI